MIFITCFAVTVFLALRLQHKLPQRRLAKKFGIKPEQYLLDKHLEGDLGEDRLKVFYKSDRNHIEIELARELPYGLHLEPRALTASRATGTFSIGDERFDDYYLLKGSSDKVIAFFDENLRELLVEIRTLAISKNKLILKDINGSAIDFHLETLIKIKESLSKEQSIQARLKELVLNDPHEDVRLQAFHQLKSYPESQDLQDFFRHVAEVGEGRVRISALGVLGMEGLTQLKAFLLDPVLKNVALSQLAHFKDEESLEILRQSLRDERLSVTAIRCLGERRDVESTATIVQVFDVHREHHAIDIVAALGKIGSPEATALLFKIVNEGMGELQNACLEALGECGQLDDVPKLHQLAETSAPKKGVLASISKIQDRLGGAQGWLSPSQSDQGGLSLSDPKPGGLSSVSPGLSSSKA